MKDIPIRSFAIGFLSFWLLGCAISASQETTPDNLTIFARLLNQAISNALDKLELEPECSVKLLSPKVEHQANWLFEKAFYNAVTQKGINEFFIKPSQSKLDHKGSDCSFFISYKPINVSVSYYQLAKTSSKKKDLVERKAAVDFYLKIQNATGKVLVAETFHKANSDTIKKTQRSLLENTNYPFTCGNSARSSFFAQFIEPLVGVLAAGAVLYMFYSFRSK